jgi:hypothetical protein
VRVVGVRVVGVRVVGVRVVNVRVSIYIHVRGIKDIIIIRLI